MIGLARRGVRLAASAFSTRTGGAPNPRTASGDSTLTQAVRSAQEADSADQSVIVQPVDGDRAQVAVGTTAHMLLAHDIRTDADSREDLGAKVRQAVEESPVAVSHRIAATHEDAILAVFDQLSSLRPASVRALQAGRAAVIGSGVVRQNTFVLPVAGKPLMPSVLIASDEHGNEVYRQAF